MTPAAPTLRAAIGRRTDRPIVRPTRAVELIAMTPRQPTGSRAARWFIRWIFLASLLLFTVVDSPLVDSLPGGSRTRLAVPVLLLAMLALARGDFRREKTLINWLIAFVLAGAASSIACAVPILGFIKLGMYVGILFPLLLCTRLHDEFDANSRGLALLTLGVGALALINAAFMPFTSSGIYGNPNTVGAFGVCVWPLLMFQTRSTSALRSRAAWCGIALCLALAVVAHSRGGVGAMLIGLSVYAMIYKRPSFGRAVVGVIVMTCLLIASTRLIGEVQDFAHKGRDAYMDKGRVFMFTETIAAWREAPMLGYGFGLSWTLNPQDAEAVLQAGRMSWFTVEFGNSTLAILSGGGLLLLAAFIGILATLAIRLARALALPKSIVYTERRELLVVLLAGIAGLLVHSQAEAWMMAPLTWETVIFWFYVGLSLRLCHTMVRERIVTAPPRPTARSFGRKLPAIATAS